MHYNPVWIVHWVADNSDGDKRGQVEECVPTHHDSSCNGTEPTIYGDGTLHFQLKCRSVFNSR